MSGMQLIGAGLKTLEQRLDIITGNLANAQTPGFRRAIARTQLFESYLDGGFGGKGPKLPGQTTIVDFAPGGIERTGQPLDVAIHGAGWFEVRDTDGELGYTRGGRFSRDAQGRLTTRSGMVVLGTSGDIILPAQGKIAIAEDGTVTAGENQVGRIKIVDFARPEELTRGKRGTLIAPPTAVVRTVEAPQLLPGAYEGSNVETTKELIDLIETQRSYERRNRVIKMMSDASAALIRAAQGT